MIQEGRDMPGAEAMTEEEMLFNGGDERAAKALVRENSDQTKMAEITAKLDAAIHDRIRAA